MNFLNTVFLYGLPLMALPVVVHLLARRRRKVIPWGAMQFLAQANPKARRSWRLKDLFLLLLRILVIACFVCALARPLVPAAWLGGHDTRDLIVVMDHSMSTQWDFGGETVHERQVELLDELLAEYEETDYIRCLQVKEAAAWLTEAPLKANPETKARVREHLTVTQGPNWTHGDHLAALEMAWTADPATPNAVRQVVLITDGQREGWDLEQTARWRAISERVEAFPSGSELRVLRVPWDDGEARDNLTVTALRAGREVVALGEPVALRATIQHFGETASSSRVVRWHLGDEMLGMATVPPLSPGASTTVALEHPIDSVGRHRFRVTLESGDGLAIDDQGEVLVQVAQGLPVLVVASARDQDRATRYLQAALGSFEEAHEGVFHGTMIAPDELAGIRLADYRAIIITQVAASMLGSMGELETFVREGGGLWLAPGPETEVNLFNALFRTTAALAPASLAQGPPIEQASEPEWVSPPIQQHPATILLADTERLDLDELQLRRHHSFQKPLPGDLSVLLRTHEGEPLVVERAIEKGRVITQGFPLGQSWSNLPALQIYVALVYEWLWYLAEPGLPRLNLGRRESYEWQVDHRPPIESAVEQTPDGRERALTLLDTGIHHRSVRMSGPLQPGHHLVTVSQGGEMVRTTEFLVAREPAESNLAQIQGDTEDQLRSFGITFDQEEARSRGNQPDGETRQESLWFWLLMGMLVFLIGESALASSIARHRQLTKQGVRHTPITR